MRVLRTLIGCAALGVALLGVAPEASPQAPGTLGTSMRGVGALLRQRVDRVLEAGAPRELSDPLLVELHALRAAPETALERGSIDQVVRDVLQVRNNEALGRMTLGSSQKAFLGSIAHAASWVDFERGVPASVTLAQAIQESGWGRAAPAYNYFGIMGVGPAGSTPIMGIAYRGGRRVAVRQYLRAYETPEQALQDHADLLSRGRAYAPARAVASDPHAFVRRLQGIYAADPRYAQRLSGIISGLGLQAFDVELPAPLEPTG